MLEEDMENRKRMTERLMEINDFGADKGADMVGWGLPGVKVDV